MFWTTPFRMHCPMMNDLQVFLRVIIKALVLPSPAAPASNRNTIASEIAVAALIVSDLLLHSDGLFNSSTKALCDGRAANAKKTTNLAGKSVNA
jgi:hypothetical protein